LGFSAETLHAAAGHAAAAGVTLGVEFLNRFECYLVTTAAETDALVRRAAHPNLRTVYDTHHAHFEEESQASAIRACAGTLGHVQLSENHRGVPGRGQVDWPDVFRTLREVGYDGHCVIESFSRIDPAFAGALHIWRDVAPSAEAVCRDGLAFVRAGWQAADRQGPLID
jgi:D-psicose/D-tagatose/L-ribulose 3-epimerase